MGRYLSGTGASLGAPRRHVIVLEASNAAVAVPSWARNGKSIALVTGVAGGGAGGKSNSSGGSGAWARKHPIIIPAGTASMSVAIGAPGTGGIVDTNDGTDGGATTLSIGGIEYLQLGGGKKGRASVANSSGVGGIPKVFGSSVDIASSDPSSSTAFVGPINTAAGYAARGGLVHKTVGLGMTGSGPQSAYQHPVATDATNKTPSMMGGNAGGHGAGGAAVSSGACNPGLPGVLIIEIVEGF